MFGRWRLERAAVQSFTRCLSTFDDSYLIWDAADVPRVYRSFLNCIKNEAPKVNGDGWGEQFFGITEVNQLPAHSLALAKPPTMHQP